ncbi:hypothetical protein AURDEDRAFT_167636 [Auricularia subglabra TFB-10046 SS5]|nr:hypothetical protein AURDEDRAFT_167636 [Auricularia subglabra TFB-10046 SS5]
MERPSLVSSYGMLEIGTVVGVFLTGIATLQTWNYFRYYSCDPIGTKLLVLLVYFLDTLQSVFVIISTYQYTILFFGDYQSLELWVWGMRMSVTLNGVIAFTVQTYFCDRVRRVRKGTLLAGACWFLTLTRFAFNILMSVTIWENPVAAALQLPRLRWQISTTLIVGAVSDVAIAVCICERLIRFRGHGVRETDRVLDRLVAFTVGSGLMTSVAAVLTAILYLKLRDYTFLVPYCAVAKLFDNSLLAWLNERDHTRRDMKPLKVVAISMPTDETELTVIKERQSEDRVLGVV